jgi:hypothetical protein
MRFEECLEDGLDQDAVCALQAPETAEHLSAAERAAIRYVDMFANNWLSMDDKFFDSMREVFTEAEIVQLGFVCALSLGMGRLMASYAITDDLPEAMQGAPGEGRYKPWEVAIDALVFPALPDGAAQTHLLDQARSHAPTISA